MGSHLFALVLLVYRRLYICVVATLRGSNDDSQTMESKLDFKEESRRYEALVMYEELRKELLEDVIASLGLRIGSAPVPGD